MKQLLLICAVVALVGGCASTPKVVPNSPEAKAAIEVAIRKAAKKPTGELTKADLEKVTELHLQDNQLTEVPKGLEKLTKLTEYRGDGISLSLSSIGIDVGLGDLASDAEVRVA